jgi:hypothetical protein
MAFWLTGGRATAAAPSRFRLASGAFGISMQDREEVKLHSVPDRDNIFFAATKADAGPGSGKRRQQDRLQRSTRNSKKILLPRRRRMC